MLVIPSKIVKHCQNLIGGAPALGSGRELDVISPYTGGAVGRVCLSSEEDVDRAVRAAHAAWPAWRRTPLRERIDPLLRLRALLLAEIDALADVVAIESGKTPA